MSALPRELIRWLQSLDLPFGVRQPKRDLSNGYLFAEIASRYWSTVELHQFENGSSKYLKELNWKALRKFFAKNGFSVPEELINATINMQDGAAQRVLELLYTALTKRVIQIVAPMEEPEIAAIPSFVKSTAMMSDLGNTTNAAPTAAAIERAPVVESSMVLTPEKSLAQVPNVRSPVEPPRPKLKPAQKTQAIRVATEDEAEGAPGVQFKAVTIRALPVAAMSRIATNETAQGGATVAASSSGPAIVAGSILGRISTIVETALIEGNSPLWPLNQANNTFAQYFSNHLGTLPINTKSIVWHALIKNVGEIAAAVERRPLEFTTVLELLRHVFPDAQAKQTYINGLEIDVERGRLLLMGIGAGLVKLNKIVAQELLRRVVLPRAIPGYVEWYTPDDRAKMAPVLASFTDLNSNGDVHRFLTALLAEFDRFGDDGRNAFLVLYIALWDELPSATAGRAAYYHSIAALHSPSPRTRALGIALSIRLLQAQLLPFAGPHVAVVEDALSVQGARAPYWELQIQAIFLASQMLSNGVADSQNEAEMNAEAAVRAAVADAYTNVHRYSRVVRLMVLTHFTSHLATKELVGSAVNQIIGLRDRDRADLFSRSPVELRRGTVSSYFVGSANEYWDPLPLIQELSARLRGSEFGGGGASQGLTRRASGSSLVSAPIPSLKTMRALGLVICIESELRQTDERVDEWWDAMKGLFPDLMAAISARDSSSADSNYQELGNIAAAIVCKFYVDLSRVPNASLDTGFQLEKKAVEWFRNVVATA